MGPIFLALYYKGSHSFKKLLYPR